MFFRLMILLSIMLVGGTYSSWTFSDEEFLKFNYSYPLLKQPWYFNSPAEILYSKTSNSIYILDKDSAVLSRVMPSGSVVNNWGGWGSESGKFIFTGSVFGYDHVEVKTDREGNLYVEDPGNKRIQKFTENGEHLRNYIVDEYLVSFAISDSGRVFALTSSYLYEFSKNASLIKKDIVCSSCYNQVLVKENQPYLSNLEDVVGFGGDDPYYSQVDFLKSYAKRIDSEFIEVELDDDVLFSQIRDHHLSDAGYYYYSNNYSGLLEVLNVERKPVLSYKFSPSLADRTNGSGYFNSFPHQVSITTDNDDYIYLSSEYTGIIQKIDHDGRLISLWTSKYLGEHYFSPRSVSVSDNGDLVFSSSSSLFLIQNNSNESIVFDIHSNEYLIEKGVDCDLITSVRFYSEDKFLILCVSDFGENYADAFLLDVSILEDKKINIQFIKKIEAFSEYSGHIDFGYEGEIIIYRPYNNKIYLFSQGGELEEKEIPIYSIKGKGAILGEYLFIPGFGGEIYKIKTDSFILEKTIFLPSGFEGDEIDILFSDGLNLYALMENYQLIKINSDGIFLNSFNFTRGNNYGSYLDISDGVVGKNGTLYLADKEGSKLNVYSLQNRPFRSKVLLVAGGEQSGNSLWYETQANANHAFWSLSNQGYTEENIEYLSHNNNLDLNGNGQPDEIDGVPTLQNIEKALTEWASDAEDVVIYMIGHGGQGTFQLGGEQILRADKLNQWLNELQAVMPGKVTVIYDACESGSFQDFLNGSNFDRTVITSTSVDENAYFQDAISFSHLFWDEVFSGKTISEAFQNTRSSISQVFDGQNPQMDSDGDGTTNTQNDYDHVGQNSIGNGVEYFGQGPTIGDVTLTEVQKGESTSTITVYGIADDGDTEDSSNVRTVWGIVRPPYANLAQQGTPVQSLPRFNLVRQTNGSYLGNFDGFEQPGSYTIAVYAQDQEGNISQPHISTLDVVSPLSQKAILVAGVDANGKTSAALLAQADYAYQALVGQGYADNRHCISGDNICYMSAGTIDTANVDRGASKAGLEDALIHWAADDTSDLVVYLVGDLSGGQYRISTTETLGLTELNQWLDQVQHQISGQLTIIHEGNHSGYLINQLNGPATHQRKRIVISSSAFNQRSYWLNHGMASFSRYFWKRVAQGASISDAFAVAQARMRRHQAPLLDSNSNTVSNEKSDYIQARYHKVGVGVLLAADEPVIGHVASNLELSLTTDKALLWADSITSLSPLNQVWAVVEPPEYDPLNHQTGELQEIQLTAQGNGRWQAETTLQTLGTHAIHYYAVDVNGRLSAPRSQYITQIRGSDAYEPDNTFTDASYLSGSTYYQQQHNFHNKDDVDYIRFSLEPDLGTYTFKADSRESQTDIAFTLYDSDYQPINLGTEQYPVYTVDSVGSDAVELAYWEPLDAGDYYIKLSPSSDQYANRLGEGYSISVFPTNAPHDVVLTGTVTNDVGNPIVGATVYSHTNRHTKTNNNGEYSFQLKAGLVSITVDAIGYASNTQQIMVKSGDSVSDTPILNFTLTADDHENPGGGSKRGDTPVIQSGKLPRKEFPPDYDYSQPIVMSVLQIQSPAGGAELHQITIKGNGTGHEAKKVKTVRVFHDVNQNKQLDEGVDTQIGVSRKFTEDNGEVVFDLDIPYQFMEGQHQILVSYDMRK